MPDDPVPSPFVKVTNERGEALELPSGRVDPPGGRIRIETDRYRAAVATEGYVSGVAAGSFLDKQTGARDLGFGLSIVDFLLEPAPKGEPVPEGQYEFGDLFHGDLPKRYVEGPQICTMAKRLPAKVTVSPGFASVRLNYRWNIAYPPRDGQFGIPATLSLPLVTRPRAPPGTSGRADINRHGGVLGRSRRRDGGGEVAALNVTRTRPSRRGPRQLGGTSSEPADRRRDRVKPRRPPDHRAVHVLAVKSGRYPPGPPRPEARAASASGPAASSRREA
ncbi:MAG: hypothetical protein WKF75_15535 [Singulisphaera sp.]